MMKMWLVMRMRMMKNLNLALVLLSWEAAVVVGLLLLGASGEGWIQL